MWYSGKFGTGGTLGSPLPLPSLPFLYPLSLSSPLLSPPLPSFLPLPLEVGPLNPVRGSEGAL